MILVTGASGKLGAYVVSHLRQSGRDVVAWSGQSRGEICGVPLRPVDLNNPEDIKQAYAQAAPSGVIHCAAVSAISDAFKDEAKARRVNAEATAVLGGLAARIVYTSTDLVFDGKDAPYAPTREPRPLSKYGASKVAGEAALAEHPGASVVRVSLMYGPSLWGGGGFFEQQKQALENSQTLRLFVDEWRTPLAYDEAARGLVELYDTGHQGLLHFGGSERLSRHQMGVQLADSLGYDGGGIEAISASEIDFPEPRPSDVSLDSTEINRLLGWRPESFRAGLKRVLN